MRTGLRWGPDVMAPLLLLMVVLFAPPPLMRLLAAALLAVRGLALAYTLAVRAGVTAQRGEPLLHANRFAPFSVTLTVRNGTPLPIHFLTVADRIGSFAARSPAQFVVGLGPWEERSFSYELEGRERGEFRLGPVDVSGTDAFGFFPWRAQLPCHQQVIVYPNIFALDLRHRRGLPSGSLKVLNKLYEDVTRYRSLREYQPGDEPKRINWKASARMGALYSMEYVPSIYFPVLVLLNLTADDYPLAQRAHLLERAVETAASLVFHFVGIGQEVGLAATGRVGAAPAASCTVEPVRAGYAHAAHLLEQLARLTAAAGEQAADVVEMVQRGAVSVANGTRVAVVTPPLREEQRAGLLALRRRGLDVEVFLVSTHRARREELTVPGLTSHTVGGAAGELVRG